VGLNATRIERLKAAGLDHIQLSLQDSTRELNDFLTSTRTFDLKRGVGRLIKQHGWPMVLNCVLHRLQPAARGADHRDGARSRRIFSSSPIRSTTAGRCSTATS
jgi:hypothetical protein